MSPSDRGKCHYNCAYLDNIPEVELQSLQVRRAAGVLMVVVTAVAGPEGVAAVAACWISPSSTAPSPPRSAPGTWVAIQWCRDNSNLI